MKSAIQLKGHRAVVTGASSGIGKEYARQLAEGGCDLVLAARRLDRLESLATELRAQYGVLVECIQVDLALPHASQMLFETATRGNKQVTLLINNAGLARYGSFLDFSLEDHRATVMVNSLSPTETSYLFVKHMLKHGQKSYITQVASISSYQPVSNFSVYSGTKAYLKVFSETLAMELQGTNVSMTCVCPGGTYTEFFEHSGQKITAKGHLTMMSAEAVVRSGLKAMLKEKSVSIPGWINKIACFVPRFLPTRLSLKLALMTMSQAVEKVPPHDNLIPKAALSGPEKN